jgi:hypothetical protein
MSNTGKPTKEALKQNLARQLFKDNSAAYAYAIVDGASSPALLDHLYGDRPEFECLYRGELEPDIAECAPYLAKLEADTPFADWLINTGWGLHWGIYAIADCDLRSLRQHLRKLNMVYDPESHKPLLFRYYDPRVLTVFLPTCDAKQTEEFFGPVSVFFAETQDGTGLARFYRQSGKVIMDV